MSLPKVAYLSMEIAVDDSLHTYSGGLGFLAGSHMLSAGSLDLPMVGVTILWGNGYGEQVITDENKVDITYLKRQYPFLTDTGISVHVKLFGEDVAVKAFRLEADTFGSVPIYFLTTDIPENKPEQRQLTDILYEGDQKTRICQEIILGQGGLRVLEAANESIDLVHLNEGHALPALFELLDKFGGNMEEVRHHAVFTTHTPVSAGNETHPATLLAEAGFFGNTSLEEAIQIGGHEFSLTVAALRMCKIANGVSQLHGHVANSMWEWVDHRCPIVAITNAVNLHYWQDHRVRLAETPDALTRAKRDMKVELFDFIHEKTGKQFDPDVLTIVWARRFTQYKRAGLIFTDPDRIGNLLKENKVQLIFAGKFHPLDTDGKNTFNNILEYAQSLPNLVVLPNYELNLSRLLKRGADVWLNTPLRPLEASGTSGMSANMNGAIHVSTFDGWAVEGTYHGINGYIINEQGSNVSLSLEERNRQDYESMMSILENNLMPLYYQDKPKWTRMMFNAIRTAEAYFHSDRMAIEYFNQLYKPIYL